MKYLLVVIALLLASNLNAQQAPNNFDTFIRVYDLHGKKISKGRIQSITNTTLYLKGKQVIPVDSIGMIKTKHSVGNDLLIGSVTGALIFSLFGMATSNPDALLLTHSKGEAATTGAMLGLLSGAAFGGITTLFKNSETYEIYEDQMKLKEFKERILLSK
ncbi:MAG TPA: hypothetical protein VK941_00225 [Gillisia sp.]|nr:hypothetical protein [Gillisia sp.]